IINRGFILSLLRPPHKTLVHQRLTAVGFRAAVKSLAAFVWLAIVQVPDYARISVSPGNVLIISFEQFIACGVLLGAMFAVSALIGRIWGIRQEMALWKRFDPIARRRYSNLMEEIKTPTNSEEFAEAARHKSLQNTENNALVIHFLVMMGMRHYADA